MGNDGLCTATGLAGTTGTTDFALTGRTGVVSFAINGTDSNDGVDAAVGANVASAFARGEFFATSGACIALFCTGTSAPAKPNKSLMESLIASAEASVPIVRTDPDAPVSIMPNTLLPTCD